MDAYHRRSLSFMTFKPFGRREVLATQELLGFLRHREDKMSKKVSYSYVMNGKVYPLYVGENGVTEEIVMVLTEFDHREELQDRYAKEVRDFKFENKKLKAESDGSFTDPINSLKSKSVEDILFPEEIQTRRGLADELAKELKENQQILYSYLKLGVKMKDIARMFNTSEDAIHKRKKCMITAFKRVMRKRGL